MIQIKRSKDEFEYEIRSLCMSFFPGREITTKEEIDENAEEVITIDVHFLSNKIGISFEKNGIPILLKEETAKIENRAEYKNTLKILLYQGLEEITGKRLPWGTLSGIRPTKQALTRLEQGQTEEEIVDYFATRYLCSEEKTKLSVEIARRELDILQRIDYKNGYSIYIGIPFCPTRCLYCSFTAYSISAYKAQVEAYIEALFKEIEYAATCLPDKKLTTIYIGGGTPTTLEADQLDRLLQKIKSTLDMTYVQEFTVEAGRPDSITYEKLEVLKRHGITRISINPQTMNQKTLDIIGRKHSVEAIVEAFHMARQAGHENINMDLIIGLPGEDVEEVMYTLEEIKKLDPENLTVHTLAIKRAAYLNIYKDRYKDLTFGDAKHMLELTKEFAKDQNYNPYYLYRQKNMSDNLENVGYAKPGKECIYNIVIMEERQHIVALGAGASSKFVFLDQNRIERVENVKDVNEYIQRVDEMIERKQKLIKKEFYGEHSNDC